MTQEEKAKAYDEALKVLHKYDGANIMFSQSLKEEMFPELKEESDDEKIRKWIISYLDNKALNSGILQEKENIKKAIAWLEKQSKASKVEQAMREVEEKAEAFTEAHKGETSEEILAQMRGEQKPAWSEEDEKMYRGLHNLIYSTPYCDSRKEFSDWFQSLKERVLPKQEQEWSEEDEKCIRLSTDIIDSALRAGFCVQLDRDRCVDWLKSLKDRCVSQQTEWSEEDELHIRELERLVKQVWAIAEHENDKDTIHKMRDLSFFLKTLKPQPRQEWSEEDERVRRSLILELERFGANTKTDSTSPNYSFTVEIKWLKSLRPQNRWKPSDEQMMYLSEAIDVVTRVEKFSIATALKELREQLKKLRGE